MPAQSRHAPPPIETDFSIYLDLVRFAAALSVFISHSILYHLYGGDGRLDGFGHHSVIVFFVLSGLVIYSTAARPTETWKTYAVARISRIYSVAIPAILLCYAVKATATFLEPDLLRSTWSSADLSVSTPISALFFLLRSWEMRILPWNGPYWSLCYEVWYYVIFGSLFFIRNVNLGRFVAVIAALVAGPAIIILFPVWFFGVWIARRPNFLVGSRAIILWALFIGSFAAFVLLNQTGVATVLQRHLHDNIPGYWRLAKSQRFLTDYAVGLLVVINFAAFRAMQECFSRVLRVSAPIIRFFAGYTFSLYLYHYPMIRFCEVIFPNTSNSFSFYILTMSAIFALCLLLGHLTEKQRWVISKCVVRIASLATRCVNRVKSAAAAT